MCSRPRMASPPRPLTTPECLYPAGIWNRWLAMPSNHGPSSERRCFDGSGPSVSSTPRLPPAELHRALEKLTQTPSGSLDSARFSRLQAVQHPDLYSHTVPRQRSTPGTAHLASDGDAVRADAAEREEPGLERPVSVHHIGSVAIGHCVLVEVGEQMGDHGGPCLRIRATGEPRVPS